MIPSNRSSSSPAEAAVVDVSVALCTRNGAAFVGEQVRSILDQRPSPREIVVGDDASSDGTISIIEAVVARYRAEHPESAIALRILRRDAPLGVTRNFEQTIAACTGSIVALCDQDDIWPAGRLARLVPLFDVAAVQLVHTDARLVDASGADTGQRLLAALEASSRELASLAAGDALPVLLRRNLVTGATTLVRRELAERAMPFPESWVHDEWLAVVAAIGGGLRLVAEPWLDYRQHGGNEIGASAPTWSRRWERLREPRDERAPRLAARSRAFLERLDRFGASPEQRAAVARKTAHEERRAGLPAWQPLRIPGIVAGVVSGRYSRYSRGAIDVLRDLVQPATRRGRR